MLSFLKSFWLYLTGFIAWSFFRIRFRFIYFALAEFIRLRTSLITADMISTCSSWRPKRINKRVKVLTEFSLMFGFVMDFLKSVETKVNQLNGLVDILLLDKVSKLELSHGLRDSDDG
jgi:hypothetical protein